MESLATTYTLGIDNAQRETQVKEEENSIR